MKRHVKKYFIPHEENDYKPHLLREQCVLVISVFVLVLFGLSIFQYTVIKNGNFAAVVSSVLVELANKDRGESNLRSLSVNEKLAYAAELKLKDMVEDGYFDHYAPDGVSPWDFMKEAGYKFTYAGENLAVNFVDSKDVEKAWMASPTHRKNILNEHYTEIGIATGKGMYKGKESVFVVQMFGKSIPQPVTPPQPTPTSEDEEIVVVEETPETIVFGDTFAVAESELVVAEEDISDIAGAEPVPTAGSTQSYASVAKKLATSPKSNLFYLYAILSGIVLLALVSLVVVEFKRQYPRYVFYGLFLILLMVFLTCIIQIYIFPEVVIK